jgi:hypothetical protein
VVLDACPDEGLKALLVAVAASEGLYREDNAEISVQRILARLEIPRIEQRLVELHRAYEASPDKHDPEARALLAERMPLQRQLHYFRQIIKGQAGQ